MTTNVAIMNRAGSPTVWLELGYQGLDVPTAFLADLELVGWTVPTPAPPPHEAIDWSQPDAATSERFTIRDYRIEGAVAQPPLGSGSRGAWTNAERAAHLAALARVLDRHATIEVHDPAGLVRPVPVSALPPPPTAAQAPVAAAPVFTPSPDAAAVLVTAPIEPSLGPGVEDALMAMGITAVFDRRDRIKRERYRASYYETTVTELHVAAVVAPSQLDAVVATLSGFGLTLTCAEVADADVAPDPAPVPAAAELVSAAMVPNRARVVVLADPRAGEAIAEVIGSLGLVDTSVSPSKRIQINTYRGSKSEQAMPALRVEARVPEPHAQLVATQLARASRVRVDDTTRVWIEPPAPANGLEAPTLPLVDDATTAPAGSPLPPPPLPVPTTEPSGRNASPAKLARGVLTRRMSPVT